jgi:hypothetical protein
MRYSSPEARSERKRIKRNFVFGLKCNPCSDCGHVYPKEAMTFDHRLGVTKEFDVFKLVDHPTATLNTVIQELWKCDLVCVGCHRDRTQTRLLTPVVGCKIHRGDPIDCEGCRQRQYLLNFQSRRRSQIDLIKSVPCCDCGCTFSPWKMDFDHLDHKLDNVSDLVSRFASWTRVEVEIAKCEIVCCWCHVFRTIVRQNDRTAA